MLPDGKGAQGAMAASPSTTRPRRAPTAGTTGTGAAGRAADPRRPASLMHAYIVVSVMAGVRPALSAKETRAIGWEEDVDLDANPLSVAALRADRAGGDTKGGQAEIAGLSGTRQVRSIAMAAVSGQAVVCWPARSWSMSR
jgi:hypothetical protein